jgi:hypothetical protein
MGNQTSRGEVYDKYYDALQKSGGEAATNVDPYDVLGLQKNFTWDELREAYRRTARWVHPDKGGNQEMFMVVTDCFKKLAIDFKMREADRPHHELKRDAMAHYANQPTVQPAQSQSQQPNFSSTKHESREESNKNFQARFNQYFDDNKFDDDETATGYGHLMEKSSKTRDELSIPQLLSGKVSADKFNSTFDEHTLPASKEIIIHREPDAMQLVKKLQFTEIGGEKPDDFTHVPQSARQGLAYTDYKVATTSTRLVDPRAVTKRKQYKNVEDYDAHRASVTEAPPTEDELAWRAQKERDDIEKEERRLARMRDKDSRFAVHYERVSRGMIERPVSDRI